MRLTHDMVRKPDGWHCVDCGRKGTIAEINAIECPQRPADNRRIVQAIEGTGPFASDSSRDPQDNEATEKKR